MFSRTDLPETGIESKSLQKANKILRIVKSILKHFAFVTAGSKVIIVGHKIIIVGSKVKNEI